MIALRVLVLEDAPKIQSWKNDKYLSSLIMSKTEAISLKEAEQWIVKNTSDDNQKLFGINVANDEGTGQIVGVLRLMFIDYDSGTTELGVYIGEAVQRGKGIGKKAIQKGIDIAFNHLNLRKIYVRISRSNKASLTAFQRIGFEFEGELRNHYYDKKNCSFENVVLLALFKV